MGSIFKSLWERIFGRTLTEEELYGRRMFGEDNDLLVAGACDMSMGGQLDVAS